MATMLKGTIGGGVTFSASKAVQKEKEFKITAALHENKDVTVHYEKSSWYCGFGDAEDSNGNDIKIGSIIPQEIDGFKILNLQEQGFYTIDKDNYEGSDSTQWIWLEANRKCILHIKGKDYNLTYKNGNIYEYEGDVDEDLGINDKEQIKVTYTLL